MTMAWTDERIQLLQSLWEKGLSARQIASELGEGITRNAVIGKAHRRHQLAGGLDPLSERSAPLR
jgi:GcrA cell cycle regulator